MIMEIKRVGEMRKAEDKEGNRRNEGKVKKKKKKKKEEEKGRWNRVGRTVRRVVLEHSLDEKENKKGKGS